MEDELQSDGNSEDGDPSTDPNEGPEAIDTPSRRGRSSRGTRGHQQRGGQSSSSAGRQRGYCSQACLLGLVLGSALDMNCPNILLHRRGKKHWKHLLNRRQFSAMVQQQLAVTLDRNVKDFNIQGSWGALFQITLASHGYTFVGKGTRDVFIPDLIHEGRIYTRLESIQGDLIPVYLGNIDLVRPWLDPGVRIIHMLLMSWGGERIDRIKEVRSFDTETRSFRTRIAHMGVRHGDLRPPNMLWNQENHKVMFIDFERATEIRRAVLQELPANRKRKQSLGAAPQSRGRIFVEDTCLATCQT